MYEADLKNVSAPNYLLFFTLELMTNVRFFQLMIQHLHFSCPVEVKKDIIIMQHIWVVLLYMYDLHPHTLLSIFQLIWLVSLKAHILYRYDILQFFPHIFIYNVNR